MDAGGRVKQEPEPRKSGATINMDVLSAFLFPTNAKYLHPCRQCRKCRDAQERRWLTLFFFLNHFYFHLDPFKRVITAVTFLRNDGIGDIHTFYHFTEHGVLFIEKG